MRFLKTPLIIALSVAIAIVIFFIYDINNQPQIPDIDLGRPITLYFRSDCPHCQNVKKFLDENRVTEKVPYNLKNVGNNQKNVDELMEKVKLCQLNPNEIGVPFLWTGEKCLSGEVEIIDFFKQRMEVGHQTNNFGDCQKLEQETMSELKKLWTEANYCNSDLDCVDNITKFSCPFGCQNVLVNKNADWQKIKDATNKYYEKCPTCMMDCYAPELKPEEIICRNKKCLSRKTEGE